MSPFQTRCILFLAHGFGTGKARLAPGTFGTLPGLFLFWLYLQGHNIWIYLAFIAISIPVSAWICGQAEKILRLKDPGSIVFDEMIAIPICFLPWVWTLQQGRHTFPVFHDFLAGNHWLGFVAILGAFRLFDIWKPWPIRQSQSLPGGWGVTIDDVLAAIYVALLTGAALLRG